MQKPKTLDDFYEQASVDVALTGQREVVELLAKARYRLHTADAHIKHLNDVVEDYRNAAAASMAATLPRFETYKLDHAPTLETALGVRWVMPEVRTLLKDWMFLGRPENIDALVADTAKRWGLLLARSLVRAVMPNSERELRRTLGAEERGPLQVNMETTR